MWILDDYSVQVKGKFICLIKPRVEILDLFQLLKEYYSLSTYSVCFFYNFYMIENLSQIIAERVQFERKKLHLSQEKLAERAGIHRTYVGMIERAEKNVTIYSLAKICGAFGITLFEFFNAKEFKDEK